MNYGQTDVGPINPLARRLRRPIVGVGGGPAPMGGLDPRAAQMQQMERQDAEQASLAAPVGQPFDPGQLSDMHARQGIRPLNPPPGAPPGSTQYGPPPGMLPPTSTQHPPLPRPPRMLMRGMKKRPAYGHPSPYGHPAY